jgi:hypothetical protein
MNAAMTTTSIPSGSDATHAGVRAASAFCALAFSGAGIAWGAMATIGMWASPEFRLRPEPRDVIPAAISLLMLLLAVQFGKGALEPSTLPMGVGKQPRPVLPSRFAVHLLIAALLGFIGFMLWTWSASYGTYPVFDLEGRAVGSGDPLWEWARLVQRASGLALILIALFAAATRTRQFVMGAKV